MQVGGLRAASISFVGAAILLCGCDRSEQQIKVYRVAKAPLDATPSADAAMPTNASSPSSLTNPTLVAPTNATTPPGWEPQPPSQMRRASFLVHGENGAIADISLVTLGTAAGNVLDNVNRWLSQLGQPPITADKLASTVEQLHTAHGDVAIVDLSGKPENGDATKDGRIIAGIASDERGTAFFKIRGNPALVGAQKAGFLKWVSSLRSETAAAGSEGSETSSDKPQINWDVPQGWSPAPASAMRYASFTTAGDSGDKIDISVVTFPGDGGSDAENVNRWRQQIGLPAADGSTLKSAIVPMKSKETDFSSIDMTGKSSRVLAAWARRDGRTWFFKLTGPNAAVEKEKPKFVKFLQSVRF